MNQTQPKLTYEDPYITLRGHKPLLFDYGRLVPAVLRMLDPGNKKFDIQTRAMMQEASAFLVNGKPSDLDIWIFDQKLDAFLYTLPFLNLGSPGQVTHNRKLERPETKNGFMEDLFDLLNRAPFCPRDPEANWLPRPRSTVIGFFPASDGPAIRRLLASIPVFERLKLFIRNGARVDSAVSIEVFREHQVWFSTRAEGYIVVEK